MNLQNKCVLITGASSGFGEACTRRYAAAGSSVVLAARNLEKLQQLKSELKGKHPGVACHIMQLDVRDNTLVDELPGSLPKEFQEIDILINNAGLALGLGGAWESDVDEWEQMLDTNCRALTRITRRILPGMVERNCGHIVNVGSVAGNWPYPGGNMYGATKAFVQQFSRNLRCDLVGKNIRVTNIEPGMADTQFSTVRFGGDSQKAAKVYEGTQPLTAEDVAETIFWSTALPQHVNINTLEVMPTCQAWSPFTVNREMNKT